MTSSLVTGLGDEVLVLLLSVTVGLLGMLAWASSFVRERPRLEAVFLQPIDEPSVGSETASAEDELIWSASEDTANDITSSSSNTAPAANSINSEAAVPGPAPGSAPSRESPVATGSDCSPAGPAPAAATSEAPQSESTVKIKVKFLNDTQREVRASLRDRLGRFKERHLADLLEDNSTVKLIFNGNVLRGEEQTLSQCGLFDNCTVHCLVSRSNTATAANNPDRAAGPSITPNFLGPEADDLDLSHICYPLLGSVLFVIWWCQLVYSHYFSLASTVSLISLTVLYLASITNTYLMD